MESILKKEFSKHLLTKSDKVLDFNNNYLITRSFFENSFVKSSEGYIICKYTLSRRYVDFIKNIKISNPQLVSKIYLEFSDNKVDIDTNTTFTTYLPIVLCAYTDIYVCFITTLKCEEDLFRSELHLQCEGISFRREFVDYICAELSNIVIPLKEWGITIYQGIAVKYSGSSEENESTCDSIIKNIDEVIKSELLKNSLIYHNDLERDESKNYLLPNNSINNPIHRINSDGSLSLEFELPYNGVLTNIKLDGHNIDDITGVYLVLDKKQSKYMSPEDIQNVYIPSGLYPFGKFSLVFDTKYKTRIDLLKIRLTYDTIDLNSKLRNSLLNSDLYLPKLDFDISYV